MPLQPILCLLALGLASVSHSQDTIAFAVNTLTIQSPHYCITVMMPRSEPRYVCPQESDSDPWDYPVLNEDAASDNPKNSWALKHPAKPELNNYFHPANAQDRTIEIHWGFDRHYSGTEKMVPKWVDKVKFPNNGPQTFYVDRFFCLNQLLSLPGRGSSAKLQKVACASACSGGANEINPYYVNRYVDGFSDIDTPISSGPSNDEECVKQTADEIDTGITTGDTISSNTDLLTGSSSDGILRPSELNTFNSANAGFRTDSENLNSLNNAQTITPILSATNLFPTNQLLQPTADALSNENSENPTTNPVVRPFFGSADVNFVLDTGSDTASLELQPLPQLSSLMKRNKKLRRRASVLESGGKN